MAAKNGHEIVLKLLIEWGAEVVEDLGGGLAEEGNREEYETNNAGPPT